MSQADPAALTADRTDPLHQVMAATVPHHALEVDHAPALARCTAGDELVAVLEEGRHGAEVHRTKHGHTLHRPRAHPMSAAHLS